MSQAGNNDAWWAGLSDGRKAQIRRWLEGAADEPRTIPGQLALMKIEKGEDGGNIEDCC